MTVTLDELHRAYRQLLLHGDVPTGVVIDPETFVALAREAKLDDPRIEWSEQRMERLFGFVPQLVPGAAATFTTRSRPTPPRPGRYTLQDLRAL